MKPFVNQELLSALKSANSLFLCTHILPDGDAVGSLLAAGQILAAMGKRVVLACADDVPRRYRGLPWADRVVKPAGIDPKEFDAAFSLDLGFAEEKFLELNMLKTLKTDEKKALFATMCKNTEAYLGDYKK